MDKEWDLTPFSTEAAQIEDTSLQIRDMKIPRNVKKLGRHFEMRRPPRNTQSCKEKQPFGYCGQTDTHEESKSCPAYGKKCMKCQNFNHFSSVCKLKGSHNGKKGNEQKRDHKPPDNSRTSYSAHEPKVLNATSLQGPLKRKRLKYYPKKKNSSRKKPESGKSRKSK